ncbi:hypothetical protein ASO20_00010 [Mycoplasma sp. (ex Biomphalaria glabrata)]|uniref:glucosamine-6-phosphate deaminase n=1 Tax=Mycoplasma sp. (ex Biomphalaria glabrata) TaxID=1749074 RepID=UPI00073AE1EC|nr:glucosamine-6-phosphate deaminase [Mycoplasma sp. (ex Biomphalaria glabrata)]ALV23065.1 hypothetical protein ASO20_00010 [Mycoplasma sp. (ex Biomphalaria glabrata)]
MIKVYIYKNKKEASIFCKDIITTIVNNNPSAVIGFATGSTFVDTYASIINDFNKNKTDWSNVKTFNLDEYLNAKKDSPFGYRYFMDEQLFSHINLQEKNIHFPNSINTSSDDLKKYDAQIFDAHLNLQLLGVGRNGHIAFNEPGTRIDSTTHIVDLAKSTIEDNARLFFNGDEDLVPKKAISMGISNIMSAQKILLAAWGESKQEAIKKLLEVGEITSNCPVTFLKKHNDVVVVLDEIAFELINENNIDNKLVEINKKF